MFSFLLQLDCTQLQIKRLCLNPLTTAEATQAISFRNRRPIALESQWRLHKMRIFRAPLSFVKKGGELALVTFFGPVKRFQVPICPAVKKRTRKSASHDVLIDSLAWSVDELWPKVCLTSHHSGFDLFKRHSRRYIIWRKRKVYLTGLFAETHTGTTVTTCNIYTEYMLGWPDSYKTLLLSNTRSVQQRDSVYHPPFFGKRG